MEGRPPENDLSYRDKLPKPGHTGDQHLLSADGEGSTDPGEDSFLEQWEKQQGQSPEED